MMALKSILVRFNYRFITFCFIIIFCFSCQKAGKNNEIDSNKTNIKNKEELIVKIEQTTYKSFPLQLSTNGTIKAQQQTQLFFKVMGEIAQINVSNTSVVRQGQVLAVIDNRQAQVAILQAQDQLKKAGFALNKLLIEYGGKDLDTSSVRPSFLESIKIQSGYYEAQTALRNAQLQYDNTYLKAPFGGTVANLKTKQHNQASLAEPFCTLLSNSLVAVETFVLESELAIVQIGQTARLSPLAFPDKSYIGKVYEINPQVNQQGLVDRKSTRLNSSHVD